MGTRADVLGCAKDGHKRMVVTLQFCKIPPWRRKGPCISEHETSTEALPVKTGMFKSKIKPCLRDEHESWSRCCF